jgi:hypothetical protein
VIASLKNYASFDCLFMLPELLVYEIENLDVGRAVYNGWEIC